MKEKNKDGGPILLNFQDVLQSYSNQDSVVLMKEETGKSMQHNRKPRTDPRKYHQRSKGNTTEKREVFSTNDL